MRSARHFILAASALVIPLTAGSGANAFEFLHRQAEPHGKALACYKKVHTPDVYRDVSRRVVIREGWQETRRIPAVYGTRHKRVQVRPGWWQTVRVPAVYGSRKRRVLVSPARTSWHTTPAVYRTVHQTRTVRPATTKWVTKRTGFLRRDSKLCKVVVPALTETVAREVMVSGPKRVPSHTAAVYAWTSERIQLTPARTKRVYHPPVYKTVSERIVMTPARSHVVNHPARYGTRSESVLVRRGTTAWKRVAPGC